MYHPLRASTIESNIEKHQTGAVAEKTLPEQIEFLDGEIKKQKSWIDFYKSPRQKRVHSDEWISKTVAVYETTLTSLEWKREVLLAKLYASKMPDIGGAMMLAQAQS